MNEHKKTVSIFIIGTEITRGIIGDKHAKLISKELKNVGLYVNRITIVPDDERLEREFLSVIKDTDIVILTGGLGPTSDDMTRTIVAEAAQVPLVRDEKEYQKLYARIGERINGANIRQVQIPQGFRIIENNNGTAPGFYGDIPVKDATVKVFALPGPPHELNPMFFDSVLPILALEEDHANVKRDEYSIYLTPESKLEEIVAAHAPEGIVWGTRVQEHKISLYISGKSDKERDALISALKADLGEDLVQKGNVEVISRFTSFLKDRNLLVSCAESCTGGLVGKLLSDESGSSAYFHSSLVTYANEAKSTFLGIDLKLIEDKGAVSEEVVIMMAENVLAKSSSDVSLAISGIAGPAGGSEEKPVGTVWFGFASKSLPAASICLQFSSFGRASVRRRAAIAALLLCYLYLNGGNLLDIPSSWQYI